MHSLMTQPSLGWLMVMTLGCYSFTNTMGKFAEMDVRHIFAYHTNGIHIHNNNHNNGQPYDMAILNHHYHKQPTQYKKLPPVPVTSFPVSPVVMSGMRLYVSIDPSTVTPRRTAQMEKMRRGVVRYLCPLPFSVTI